MELLTGFLIGFLGSFHCIGMCGPIAVALPKTKPLIISRSIYNFGRIITYSLIGLLFGLLGSRLEMFGIQQFISISLGIIILLAVLLPHSRKAAFINLLGLNRILGIVKYHLGSLFKNHSKVSMLLIGMLNGLLPCGLVYLGITGAIAIGDPVNSMFFMTMFGIGTLPMMLGASMLGAVININLRKKLTKVIPVFTVVLAVVFILRGLNLGIPYISPKTEVQQQTQVICH